MKNFYDKLVEYAYDELDASDVQEVEHLIHTKPQLLQEVQMLRRSRQLLKMLPDAPVPSLSKERLQKTILESQLSHRCTSAWPKWVGAGAIVALLFVYITRQNFSVDSHSAHSSETNVFADRSNNLSDSIQDMPMTEIGAAAIEAAMKDAANRVPETVQVNTGRYPLAKKRASKNNRGVVAPVERKTLSDIDVLPSSTTDTLSIPAEVIVIEPSSGSASEFRSTDDFAIGG